MSNTMSMATTMLFQKSLTDMIKGIRTNKKGEVDFIQQCLDEIRQELKHKEMMVKVNAISKLTYLYMLGYDMDFAAFHVIEVMSETSFQSKRVGYLAATLAFHERLEVLPLVTNLVKKDLVSSSQFEVGLALTCLANICTPELAHDLVSDVVGLLNSQRNYVRKKAVLCLYRVIQQFPGALRPTFPRLFEKLDEGSDKFDPDPVVRCAVVSVLCELSRKHPANYLGLAVSFYNLLCSQLNNWTMIKIVKLFAALTPHEPRLGKKIAEPMANIINSTQAKSLCFEACLTVAIGLGKTALPVTRLALEKLRGFIEDPDQNLKYLGLVGMTHFMSNNPKLLVEFREIIVDCLKDNDSNIRARALDLTQGLVSKKSLMPIVSKMCSQLVRSPPDDEWTNLLIKRIIETCTQDDYSLVTDFEWYLRVLMDLTQTQSTNFDHGDLIAQQFLEITQRVEEIREFSVKCIVTLLSDPAILTTATNLERSTHWKILRVCAHIASEYVSLVPNLTQLIQSLVDSRLVSLPGEFQSVCVSSLEKVVLYALHTKSVPLEDILSFLCPETKFVSTESSNAVGGMEMFYHSPDVEAQERALLFKKFALESTSESQVLLQKNILETISIELMPVAQDAQKQVPFPEGLDLDTPITLAIQDDDDDSEEWSDQENKPREYSKEDSGRPSGGRSKKDEYAVHRKAHAALYLKEEDRKESVQDDSLPPIAPLPAKLAKEIDLGVSGLQKKKPKKYSLASKFEAPQGYVAKTKLEPHLEPKGDEDDGLNIDVLKPIGKDEVLPTIQPYQRPEVAKEEEERAQRKAQRKARASRTRKDTTLVSVSKEDMDVVVSEGRQEEGSRVHISLNFEMTNKLAVSMHHLELSLDNLPACALILGSEEGKQKKLALVAKLASKGVQSVRVIVTSEDSKALLATLPLKLSATIHYKTKEIKHARVACEFPTGLWMCCPALHLGEEEIAVEFRKALEASKEVTPVVCTFASSTKPGDILNRLAGEERWGVVEVMDDAATMCVVTKGGLVAVLLRKDAAEGLELVLKSNVEALVGAAVRVAVGIGAVVKE